MGRGKWHRGNPPGSGYLDDAAMGTPYSRTLLVPSEHQAVVSVLCNKSIAVGTSRVESVPQVLHTHRALAPSLTPGCVRSYVRAAVPSYGVL